MTDPLAIYLDDHMAAATGGLRLAVRARDAHRDRSSEIHQMLVEVAAEIREDREELRRIANRVGASPSRVKQVAATAAELSGRLKSNGSVLRRSPLSSLVELEGLAIAVQGKRCGWTALNELSDERLADVDFERLIARAESQYERIETCRRRVAVAVLSRRSA